MMRDAVIIFLLRAIYCFAIYQCWEVWKRNFEINKLFNVDMPSALDLHIIIEWVSYYKQYASSHYTYTAFPFTAFPWLRIMQMNSRTDYLWFALTYSCGFIRCNCSHKANEKIHSHNAIMETQWLSHYENGFFHSANGNSYIEWNRNYKLMQTTNNPYGNSFELCEVMETQW